MKSNTLNQLLFPYVYWYATRLTRKLGWAGLIGVGLILASIAFTGFKLTPTKQLILQQKMQFQAQQNGNLRPHAKDVTSINPQVDIAKFYANFPQSSQLAASLKRIQNSAIKNKLVLNRGDYKFTLSPKTLVASSNNNTLARYEIQLPMTGQYIQIRSFVDEVLLQLPTLVLSDMQIKRESSSSSAVDARLTFVLLVMGETWQ
jgi:Tfp pilus assembly protein PilO